MIRSAKFNDLVAKFKRVTKEGFFHIFASRLLNRIVRFGASIIVVRILSKELYGSFSYATNILQFFLLLNGLGVVHALLQFCSEKKERAKKLAFLKYGGRNGLIFNVFLVVAIVVFVQFFKLPVEGSSQILLWMCFIPVATLIFEMMGSYLRSDFRNKEFSYLNMSNTILYSLATIIGGYFFAVQGIVFGRYLAFVITILIGSHFLKNEILRLRSTSYPAKTERKEFLKYSILASSTISFSQILYLLDIFLIGIIISDQSVVAVYKVGTLIPFSMNLIPQSIMVFAYPYFASNYQNKEKIKRYFYELQKYVLVLNMFISIVSIVFAPIIIKIVFGSQYQESVTVFRILMVGFFIDGSFKILAGNIIASVRKVKINFYNGIFCGVVNILLDIILILNFGVIGAAITTTTVLLLSSLISLFSFLQRIISSDMFPCFISLG
jgi:O-antigen/teichoic acid export membrane protein